MQEAILLIGIEVAGHFRGDDLDGASLDNPHGYSDSLPKGLGLCADAFPAQ